MTVQAQLSFHCNKLFLAQHNWLSWLSISYNCYYKYSYLIIWVILKILCDILQVKIVLRCILCCRGEIMSRSTTVQARHGQLRQIGELNCLNGQWNSPLRWQQDIFSHKQTMQAHAHVFNRGFTHWLDSQGNRCHCNYVGSSVPVSMRE